jgi:hypothetical protein
MSRPIIKLDIDIILLDTLVNVQENPINGQIEFLNGAIIDYS